MTSLHTLHRMICAVSVLLFSSVLHAEKLPNIILMMGDDHGWEETGYYNHPHVKTPVLDEMASQSLRLDNFYAGHPTCSPTRASFLTGRHPNRMGTFTPNYSFRPEEITIAHLAKKAGYATAHFGKWHVGPVKKTSPTCPGAMGFDRWLSHDNFFELNPVLSPNGEKPQLYPGESSEVLVEHAVQFIKNSRQQQKPFLIVIWFGSPHEPYSGLEKDLKLYDDLPREYADRNVKLTSNETGKPTRRPLRDVLRERYAEITAMDRSIGTLRSHLKSTDQRDNTLLWYCGDNGTPSSGYAGLSPLRGMKATMYEGGIRVPGIIEWPAKIKSPRITTVSSVTSDMLPTICSIIGQPVPNCPLDGIDILPLIEDKMNERPKPIHFWALDVKTFHQQKREPYISAELQSGTTPLVKLMGGIPTRNFTNYIYPNVRQEDYAGKRVILDGKYKLIVSGDADSNVKTELYDLDADIAEAKNLAADEPQRVHRMSQQLRGWQKSVLTSLTGNDYRE